MPKRKTQYLPKNVSVILDLGHSYEKAKLGTVEIIFPHALQEIAAARWIRDSQRTGNTNPDYIRVNDLYCVVGDTAEFHGVSAFQAGASRYTREYYGVLMCAALTRLFDEPVGNLVIFASHPPGDAMHAEKLAQSLTGKWEVECMGKVWKFNITEVYTYDEPIGGLMNAAISDNGNVRPEVLKGKKLIVDIGGGTTSITRALDGIQVDYTMAESFPRGIRDVMKGFEDDFRAANLDLFRDTRALAPDRIRDALITGVFVGGGREIRCEEEVERALTLFLNDFNRIYLQRAGGPFQYDTIVLTGGGASTMGTRLHTVLNHGNVIYAEDPQEIHLANVRGGRKIYTTLVEQGVINV